MLTRSSSLNDVHLPFYRRTPCQIERRHSFAGAIADIKNSDTCLSPVLKRREKKENLSEGALAEFINFRSELIYNKIDDYRAIDASNYISLGAASAVPYNQHGITLNENGELMLIKGESHNLVKGLLKKYATGFKYQTASIVALEGCAPPRFSRLFINEHGVLIGKNLKEGTLHAITIKNHPGHYDQEFRREQIEILIKPYNGPQVDNLTFKISEGKNISFSFEEGKLYLDTIETTEKKLDYSLCAYDVTLPLKKGIRLISVKKSGHLLQLELAKKNKKRIVYLDPLHISEKKVSARHLSHKPGQSLANRLGADPYEKYHSGQPFTSTRLGNFSSKYIPLILNNLDRFRIHLKKAKEENYKGNRSQAMQEGVKSLDPGVEAILTTSRHLIKQHKTDKRYSAATSATLLAKNRATTFANNKQLRQLVAAATGLTADKETLAASLLQIVSKLAPDEALTLSFNNALSFFLGTAAGGVPFNPGWFAGIVGSIMSSHNLILSPDQKGNILFTFANEKTRSLTPFIGTGQGLEKNLLAAGGANYMTVMPLEANIILMANSTNSDSFSFALKKENVKAFLDSMLTAKASGDIESQIIKEAEVKKRVEKSLILKVECKVEGRVQNGRMLNNTFVVLPRSAAGASLSANLLKLDIKKEKTIEGNDIKAQVKVKTLSAANIEAELFNENTIMPIPVYGSDPVLCFPLPLQQDKNATTLSSPSLFHKEKTEVTLFTDDGKKVTPEHSIVANALPDTLIKQSGLQEVANLPVIHSANKNNKMTLKALAGTREHFSLLRQDLKEIVHSLQQQERGSMGKDVSIHVFANYELIESDRQQRTSLEEQEKRLANQPDKLAKAKMRQELATLKKNARYRLKNFTLYRSSQLTQKASMALAIISFTQQNQILLSQRLEKVDFCYDGVSETVPAGFTSRASFIR